MQREEEEDKSEMMMEKISRLWDRVAFWNNQIYYGAIIGIISEGRSNFPLYVTCILITSVTPVSVILHFQLE